MGAAEVIRGVDMNATHIRVWTMGGPVTFRLPRGRRPTMWTALQAVTDDLVFFAGDRDQRGYPNPPNFRAAGCSHAAPQGRAQAGAVTCTLGCVGQCQGHTNPILDAINQAAAAAMDLGGRPTVFTAGPSLTAALGRARAMRALCLPHPWAPNTRASRRRLARLLLDTFPPGTITGL